MEEKKTINLKYKQPKLARVFSAHFFDFFSYVVIGVIFIALSVLVLHNTSMYKSSKNEQANIQIKSNLYVNDNSSSVLITDKFVNDNSMKTEDKIDKLSTSLTYFFDEFLKDNSSINDGYDRYTKILTSYKDSNDRTLFDEHRNRVFTNSDEDSCYLTAYSSIVTKYAIGYLSYVNDYSNLRKQLVLMTVTTILIALSFSNFVVYLLIPLFFRRGRKTFGFLLNRIGYVSLDGFSPSVPKVIFKFLFQWILIFLASFFTLGIPLFISVGMVFLSKHHQTLSDYIFGEILVDTEQDIIYLDYFDYKTAHVFDSNDVKNV